LPSVSLELLVFIASFIAGYIARKLWYMAAAAAEPLSNPFRHWVRANLSTPFRRWIRANIIAAYHSGEVTAAAAADTEADLPEADANDDTDESCGEDKTMSFLELKAFWEEQTAGKNATPPESLVVGLEYVGCRNNAREGLAAAPCTSPALFFW
jgi:hypothetical protein